MSPQTHFREVPAGGGTEIIDLTEEVHDPFHRRRDIPSTNFALTAVTLGQATSQRDTECP